MSHKTTKNPMKDYFSYDCILLAWERYIRCNQKEAKDYLGIKAFGSNLEDNIHRLTITTDKLDLISQNIA